MIIGQCSVGTPYFGCFGPGRRLPTIGGGLASWVSPCASTSCTFRYSLPAGARKRYKIGDRVAETRRFRSVPRTFPGFLLGPGNILFVFLFAQVGASAPIPTEMISPHSRVKQTHLCHQDHTLSASQRDGGFMQTRPGLVDVTSARPASDRIASPGI